MVLGIGLRALRTLGTATKLHHSPGSTLGREAGLHIQDHPELHIMMVSKNTVAAASEVRCCRGTGHCDHSATALQKSPGALSPNALAEKPLGWLDLPGSIMSKSATVSVRPHSAHLQMGCSGRVTPR